MKKLGRIASTSAVILALLASENLSGQVGQPGAGATSITPISELAGTTSDAAVTAVPGVDVVTGVPFREPTVAVNPTNFNNVVVAGLFQLRVSIDRGMTFSAATPAAFPMTHSGCGDPSIAFDRQGRLFWTYLGCIAGNLADVFIAQVNPNTGAILAGYPVNVSALAGFPAAPMGANGDKQWIAIDKSAGPFQDRIYVSWTDFGTTPTQIVNSYSTDQGANWTAGQVVSLVAENFVWPLHHAVASNGDAYLAYHSQPGFGPMGVNPDGVSGNIVVLRSVDGGVTWPQRTIAFTGGNADLTFNRQFDGVTDPRRLVGSISWTQGSSQPWLLPDPFNPATISVVAADDPTNAAHMGANDDANVYIVRSTDSGLTWGAPAQIDAGPAGRIQFFPTASIDEKFGCIAVTYYKARTDTNAGGNFLLDLAARGSANGGLSFGPEIILSDLPFDPDAGAGNRFPNPPNPDTLPTLRIGEYNGVAHGESLVHAVWTGNDQPPMNHLILYDNTFSLCPEERCVMP